jgi:hypothetical protein
LLALAIGADASAQVQGGSISGTVRDEQSGVLPGVLITAQGLDATHTFTTEGNGEYRFFNLAPGPYKLTAALSGFTTLVRDNVIVSVGRNVELSITLRLASVAETVTVSGESPIIDTKATGTATNLTLEELTAIPTSRDPYALLRTVPGVLIDRVNIGGNESGQQANFASKGTRPQDVVWTLDGINITDMASTSSPTYFNFDDFEEIQMSTAGQDIKQPTGGLGVNLVIKRGTNQFRGGLRGYLVHENLESDNTHPELKALGYQHSCDEGAAGCLEPDHNQQITDWGFEIGGPVVKDKAWFYGSYSVQDIRLVRRSGALVDKTVLKNPNVKVNWQASARDMVSFLYFNGDKIKEGRSPGTAGILFDAPGATFRQSNGYSDFPLHGLWKIQDDRTIGSNMFLSAKFAYYNIGFVLDPTGGLEDQAGRSFVTATSYGSINQSLNLRPQKILNLDANSFLTGMGVSHDLKYGFGFRQVDTVTGTLWPGNMILAIEQSATDHRAQVFRQGYGKNRADYLNFYIGDTIALNRATLDLGLRYDRQWGEALPSQTLANAAFPTVVPGIDFAGYKAPFTWKNFSPRAGLIYALDDARKTVARLTYARFAGQLATTTNVGFLNPSANVGSVTYRWSDLNGDRFAQANEVDLTRQVGNPTGGFNPANPTAVTTANQIDPDFSAPITQNLIAGVDHELIPNLALQVNYSYTRTSNLFGNFTGSITPRVNVTLADYAPGTGFSGTLPDGQPYDVPTWIPNAAKVAAGGSGFILKNIPDYYTDFNGIEVGIIKRLSNRWMGRAAFSWNNAREHFTSANGMYDTNGNPTPTVAEPLKDGGQFTPQSGGSGGGNVYINAKWTVNLNAMYEAPYGLELSANVFGRQGYPFPWFRQGSAAALGGDSSLSVLVVPAIDYKRYDNLWNTDVRVARTFHANRASIRVIGDIFNLMNANTVLVRNGNITSTSFNALSQNLSPRCVRFGVVLGF